MKMIASMVFYVGISLVIIGCPKPTPDPVLPANVDAPVIDAPPADCAMFAGVYNVSDQPMSGSQSCSKASRDVIHIEVHGGPDPDSNQWDILIISEGGATLNGVAKQVDYRPYVCRFIVGYDGPQEGLTTINRDFYLGEQKDIGVGETVVKNSDCLWQSTSVLTRVR